MNINCIYLFVFLQIEMVHNPFKHLCRHMIKKQSKESFIAFKEALKFKFSLSLSLSTSLLAFLL